MNMFDDIYISLLANRLNKAHISLAVQNSSGEKYIIMWLLCIHLFIPPSSSLY